MHNVSRTNFMEQKASEDGNGKRRMQAYKIRKIVLEYIIKLKDGCKGTQTAKQIFISSNREKAHKRQNKTVLVVSLIYKVRAHATL